MSTKTITVPLSSSGISAVVAYLEGYSKRLEKKADELLSKMLREGEFTAKVYLTHIDTGATLNSIMGYREGDHGIIAAGGAAIWIEFGTGVTYNHELHPKASELGMSPHGTYGEGHGADPNGWYYKRDDGEVRHTYGIPQNRFMYSTAQMLRREYKRMATEVFA